MKDKRLVSTAILDEEAFNALPAATREFGFRLERIVDDFGLFRADVRFLKLKAAAYAADITERRIPAMLDALESVNFIQRYTVDGKPFAVLVSNVNRHRTKPTCPLPPGYTVERQSAKEASERFVIVKTEEKTEVGDKWATSGRQVGDNLTPNRTERKEKKKNSFSSGTHAPRRRGADAVPVEEEKDDPAKRPLTDEEREAITKSVFDA